MQIEQEDVMPNEKKSKKTITLIVILITITIIAVIGIVFAIMALQGDKLSASIDGKKVSFTEDTFIFTEDGKVYVSIKDIAPLVGYEAHNGEYKVDTEDTNKMYVEALNGTETTSFFLNSTTISKAIPNTNAEYENLTISQPVFKLNDKLYVISDGFSMGFNSIFYYDETENSITIQTLPYLYSSYSARISDFGYSKISEEFNNQKAMVYGLIVASKESTGKYGVITTTGNEVISPRYNKIQFIETSKEFIITNSSEKVGIAYNTGKTKITVSYDDIKVLDNTSGLYLVKSNNKYGIINSLENFIVYIEYDQIGIDTSNFPTENISNQYILYNKIIPASINGKWILLDTNGNRLTQDEYDGIGYINTELKDRVVNNALLVGDTGTIIVSKDGKYGGIDIKGNDLIQIRYDAIYSVTSGGETVYYILFNGTEYNAVDLINAMKEILGYEDENDNIVLDNTNNTEGNTIDMNLNANITE